MVYYYIVDSVGSSDKMDLSVGPRIIVVNENLVFDKPGSVLFVDDGEGPYESLKQLKENSEIYQNLLVSNPSRAVKILKFDHHIPFDLMQGAVFTAEEDDEFHRIAYPILVHTLTGRFGKNDVYGVHYFDADRIRITSLIGYDEITQVKQAYIEVYNANADRWVKKYEPATFFPFSWTLSDIITECQWAYKNRMQVSVNKYKGISKSGVLIVFVFNESDELKTVYPVCEEIQENA